MSDAPLGFSGGLITGIFLVGLVCAAIITSFCAQINDADLLRFCMDHNIKRVDCKIPKKLPPRTKE